MNYTCIRIEGGLLSPDFLESIHEQEGQKPGDFKLESRRSLVDEVSSVYEDARVYWKSFQRRLSRKSSESVTTITRQQWVIPLLESIGFELTFQHRALEADGRTYSISHCIGDDQYAPPVHIVGSDQELGSRPPAGRGTMAPHALVQDYLNRTESLWGIVTNGLLLRLLRDTSQLTRAAYIEFDLEQMMEGERLDEFILFYRIVHRTRFPGKGVDASSCLLEKHRNHAIDQGGRIRDGLRDAVENAIKILANGFLSHPKNESLRDEVRNGTMTERDLYRELLYLIYRFLFLVVAEERSLLCDDSKAWANYQKYHSISRLRTLADTPLSAPGRFDDLWLGLRTLFYALREEKFADALGLPTLNGELFHDLKIETASLDNLQLLIAIHLLSHFQSSRDKVRRRINYAALDVEELGSVYESLLDLQPQFQKGGGRIEFAFITGTERKTTGSYYTRPELVKELIESALVPVIEERLKDVRSATAKEETLLTITVCDPACGSGHFLLAASRRLGLELARVRTEDVEPSPEARREATRDVITHCIYGVDKNPLAVDLCKVALWIEGHNKDKPLTFLDYRIRCGDSLVGVHDLRVLEDGIPDEAFRDVTGDERVVAQEVRRRNRSNLEEDQLAFVFDVGKELEAILSTKTLLLELNDDTPDHVRRKADLFQQVREKSTILRTACDLWSAPFFAKYARQTERESIDRAAERIPVTATLATFFRNPGVVYGPMLANASHLAQRQRFLHWPLEFPEVFAEGGFDVILCNPPWERIKLQEQEFFATRDAEIALAPNKAARQRLIRKLEKDDESLFGEYKGGAPRRRCAQQVLTSQRTLSAHQSRRH